MNLKYQICSNFWDQTGPIYNNYIDALSVALQYLPEGHISVLDDVCDPPICLRWIDEREIVNDYDNLVRGKSLKIRRLRCRSKRDLGLFQMAYASHPKEYYEERNEASNG